MLNDPLASALSKIDNAERMRKSECLISPVSGILKKILSIMQENMYIGAFEEIEDSKGKKIKVNLIGGLNRCNAIKPRFNTKNEDIEKWEKRYLPAKDFGIIFISTPEGVMKHNDAKEKNQGGILIGYCY